MENELKCPKFKTDDPIVRALFERALAGPPKKKTKVEPALAPKFKTDGTIVRALFVRALAGPHKKKGTPLDAEVKKG